MFGLDHRLDVTLSLTHKFNFGGGQVFIDQVVLNDEVVLDQKVILDHKVVILDHKVVLNDEVILIQAIISKAILDICKFVLDTGRAVCVSSSEMWGSEIIIIPFGNLCRRRRFKIRFPIGVGSIVNQGGHLRSGLSFGLLRNIQGTIIGSDIRLNWIELLECHFGIVMG
jgi:hypothetical protein